MMRRLRNLTNPGNRGFTVIELMIAMVIGLILLLGLTQIYILSKQSYTMQGALSRLQETGRFVMNVFKKELRQADNWGCAETITNNLKTSGSGYIDYLNSSVSGSNGTTDTITLQRAVASGSAITTDMANTASAVTITAPNAFNQNDIVIMSDCLNGDIFQITSASPGASGSLEHASGGSTQPGNASNVLFKAYTTSAMVYKVRAVGFSIATGASGENALFRSIDGSNQELVDGVENMQILYGVDTDADYSANQYVTADSVGTWNNVISVRVSFLLRSEDNVTRQHQTYTFNGTQTTATDYRYRQVYTTTVNIRNRQK